jgi:hypothetical protein
MELKPITQTLRDIITGIRATSSVIYIVLERMMFHDKKKYGVKTAYLTKSKIMIPKLRNELAKTMQSIREFMDNPIEAAKKYDEVQQIYLSRKANIIKKLPRGDHDVECIWGIIQRCVLRLPKIVKRNKLDVTDEMNYARDIRTQISESHDDNSTYICNYIYDLLSHDEYTSSCKDANMGDIVGECPYCRVSVHDREDGTQFTIIELESIDDNDPVDVRECLSNQYQNEKWAPIRF